jgi:hypothetical protein
LKSALSLTLIVCLFGSALPVTAQEQTETSGSFDLGGPVAPATAAGPLARAVMRQAVRLAAVQSGGTSAESNWSRVRKLASGTEIIVTVKGSRPTNRYFLAGDESELMVLNVADPALPVAARDLLRDAASVHPKPFPGAQQAGPKNVRVGPDGVFVADQKVTDLGQVEHIARTDIAEIKTPPKSFLQRYWESGHGRGLALTVAGVLAGGVIGAVVVMRAKKCDTCGVVGLFYGGIAGGVIGKVLAYRWAASHDVIYRAP